MTLAVRVLIILQKKYLFVNVFQLFGKFLLFMSLPIIEPWLSNN